MMIQTDASFLWENWGRTEKTSTASKIYARNVEELASRIRTSPDTARFKVLGSGHSFSGISLPEQYALDICALSGVLGVDVQRKQVRLGAGTHLWEIPALLAPFGLAMENLGDIDRQTLAGAISTGTHGTGSMFGSLSTQIVGVSVITGKGEVLEVDEDRRSDLLPFLRLGLGALGVITDVTVQCVPAFVLHAQEKNLALEEVFAGWDELFDAHDHFEFHWFPRTRDVVAKINTRLPSDAPLNPRSGVKKFLGEELLANHLFKGLCEAGRIFPASVPGINKIATVAMGRDQFAEPSAKVFATSRKVRFREMEYAVARSEAREVFGKVRDLADSWPDPIEFPIEVRTARRDENVLSTAYEQDVAYIAVHRYIGKEYKDYFSEMEKIFIEYGGRPHWGKMHTRDAEYFSHIYPRYQDFLTVRNELDPLRRFSNPYLRKVLGT